MNNDLIHINTLPPFKRMCVSIGALPTSFMESMTYYEALEWLYKYLADTIIPTVNNTGEAVTELQAAFITLKDYVDNYFENLDVQEEINNKLDEMAESGELTDIIAQYLGLAGVLAYNTVADMKSAENLVNGSIAKTLGFYNYNDKGGANYKIRTITNEDTVDEMTIIALNDPSLVAELLPNNPLNTSQCGIISTTEENYTNKIQSIIDYCYNKNINLEFNKNTYYVDSLTFKCNINGNGSTFSSLYFSTLNPVAISYYSNIKCENMIIDGNSKNTQWNRTSMSEKENIVLNNIEFKNFTDTTNNNSWGLLITKSHNILINNCKGSNCTQSVIAVTEDSTVNLENCVIDSLNVEPNTFENLVKVSVKGCIINKVTSFTASRKEICIVLSIINSKINILQTGVTILNLFGNTIGSMDNTSSYYKGSIRGNIENELTLGYELNTNPYFTDVFNGTSIDTTKGYTVYVPTAQNTFFRNDTITGIGSVLTINYDHSKAGNIRTDNININENKQYLIKLKYIADSTGNSAIGQIMMIRYYDENDTQLSSEAYNSCITKGVNNTGLQTDYLIVTPVSGAKKMKVYLNFDTGSNEALSVLELSIKEISYNLLQL